MSFKVFWGVATVQSVILEDESRSGNSPEHGDVATGELFGRCWHNNGGRLRFSEVEELANCSELRPWRLSVPEFPRPVFAVEGGEMRDTEESSGEL